MRHPNVGPQALLLLVALAASAACSRGQATTRRETNIAGAATPAPAPPVSAVPSLNVSPLPWPDGLAPDDDCPEVDPPPDAEAESTPAIVPLVPGLTLSYIWKEEESDPDRECLTQVGEADATSFTVTNRCPSVPGRQIVTWTRRICRADLQGAYMYHPGTRTSNPRTIRGTTMFTLSSRAFRELNAAGATRHRYIHLSSNWRSGAADRFDFDRDGTLAAAGAATIPVILNDRPVAVAARLAAGTAGDKRVRVAVLDDERLPIVLDYSWSTGFSVRYSKISFPGGIADRLASDGRVDVYGIYFDFARDDPREESRPVLREIADALRQHPDWILAINGHTDDVGGDRANLDLSYRRSASIRRELIDHYGIAAGRLTTSGLGASQPKETNGTIEGRARNRRVELIRQ